MKTSDLTMDRKRLILVGFFTNVFEWYDFSIYAYLASIIGIVFFNENDPQLALLKSFVLFSISFFIRPLGSLFFGYISDHYGRSITLKISLLLMAIPTFLIGLLPSYHTAGFISVVSLVILRLLQGFATGGELPASTCYMYESSPSDRKNFYCSLVAASSTAGVFLASIVVTLLYFILSQEALISWGWRIPFLLGFCVAFFIFKIRNMICETEVFKSNLRSPNVSGSYIANLIEHKYQILKIFLLNAFISAVFYMQFVWMPFYLTVYLKVESTIAHLTTSISLLFLIMFTLLVGYISSNHNRQKWINLTILSYIIFAYPLFLLLQTNSLAILLMIQITFALLLSFMDGVIGATMGSMFETKIRGSGLSIGFTFATAIFGGLTPTLSNWLINQTGYVEAPVYLIIGIAIFSLPAIKGYKYQEAFAA